MTQYLPADRFQSVLPTDDEFCHFQQRLMEIHCFVSTHLQHCECFILLMHHERFLSQLVDMLQFQSSVTLDLVKIFQTQMAAAIKEMVLMGHGVGWLPESCAAAEPS
jgi:DNA-binding transcriptional LysR family regulator